MAPPSAAAEVDAAAIVVVEPPLTELVSLRHSQGALTRAVSQGSAARPDVPIVALSSSLKVCRQLSISRAVVPAHVTALPTTAEAAAAAALSAGLVAEGSLLVVLCGSSLAALSA